MLGSADSFDVDCSVIVPKDLFLDNHMAVIPTQEFSTTPKEKEYKDLLRMRGLCPLNNL